MGVRQPTETFLVAHLLPPRHERLCSVGRSARNSLGSQSTRPPLGSSQTYGGKHVAGKYQALGKHLDHDHELFIRFNIFLYQASMLFEVVLLKV